MTMAASGGQSRSKWCSNQSVKCSPFIIFVVGGLRFADKNTSALRKNAFFAASMKKDEPLSLPKWGFLWGGLLCLWCVVVPPAGDRTVSVEPGIVQKKDRAATVSELSYLPEIAISTRKNVGLFHHDLFVAFCIAVSKANELHQLPERYVPNGKLLICP